MSSARCGRSWPSGWRHAGRRGSAEPRIAIDPGFGFGKTLEHNLTLLRHLRELTVPGLPVLVGLSRKSMVRHTHGLSARRACSMAASRSRCSRRSRGARIIRAHDVAATVEALQIVARRDGGENELGRRYFGTDGVRGRVGEHPMTVDFALRLASAAARVLAPEGGTVLIGKDTRLSGYMFESALEAGFVAAGVDVMLIGPLPTPGDRLHDAALQLQLRRRHQRLAQPLRGQRHQVLRR